MLSLATELPTADVPAVVRLRTTQARPGTPARVLLFWGGAAGCRRIWSGREGPWAGAIPRPQLNLAPLLRD